MSDKAETLIARVLSDQRERERILKRVCEFVKYGTIGALSVAVNYLIIALLTVRLGLHYLVSIVVSYLTVTLMSFRLNRGWTFGKSSGSVGSDFVRYVTITGIQYALYAMLFAVCVGILHVTYQLTAVALSIVLAPVGYLLHRRLSFQLRWFERSAASRS